MPEFSIVQNPVRLPFGLALFGGVLTLLRQPLSPDDSLSSGCRPSQTAHQPLSPASGVECRNSKSVVFHLCLHHPRKGGFEGSHIRCANQTTTQRQAAVKLHGVSATRWESQAFAPGWYIRRVLGRDSGGLVKPSCAPTFNRQGISLP